MHTLCMHIHNIYIQCSELLPLLRVSHCVIYLYTSLQSAVCSVLSMEVCGTSYATRGEYMYTYVHFQITSIHVQNKYIIWSNCLKMWALLHSLTAFAVQIVGLHVNVVHISPLKQGHPIDTVSCPKSDPNIIYFSYTVLPR